MKIWEIYGKNGLITGHLSYRRAIGSIGNEFAASISSSLSPSRPPRASKIPKITATATITTATTILYGKKLVSKKLGHPVFLTDF